MRYLATARPVSWTDLSTQLSCASILARGTVPRSFSNRHIRRRFAVASPLSGAE